MRDERGDASVTTQTPESDARALSAEPQRHARTRPASHASQLPLRCEGYGPGGTAVVVDCRTDDRRRTIAALRTVFARYGGQLGAENSVGYLFSEVGVLSFAPREDAASLRGRALDLGAEDVVTFAGGALEVLTAPLEFELIRAALREAGFEPQCAQLTRRAALVKELRGDSARSMTGLLATLEDLDDVQNVYSNAAIPAEFLARIPA
jgi:transcriptional/translational regulatory protein YebC/TACO1